MGILDLNNIKEALQIAGKIEFYPQILEMQEKLLEQQKKITDLETVNRELNKKLKTQESLIFEDDAYWIEKDGKKDGPHCSCCWDSEDKLVRLHPSGNPAYAHCPKCKNTVKVYPHRDNPPRANHFIPDFR